MIMGIDDMLAVNSAGRGKLFHLLFGLILSIPFVKFISMLLDRLMDCDSIIF
jgi:hypothetical protein